MALSPFRAVIFDCDGVLVDSEALGLRTLQLALREAGVERSPESLFQFTGRSHGETLAQLESESGMPLLSGNVAERMDEFYMRLVETDGLNTLPGVRELLSWLVDYRIPFTLASSGPRRKVLFSLRNAGLAAKFPRFVCGDDVSRAKPAPDVYLAAAELIGFSPADCLAIEDAPNGIRAASAAGMQVVGLTSTFASDRLSDANLVVDSLAILLSSFENLFAQRPAELGAGNAPKQGRMS
ncbi:MAG TPA: HAD family phosphatase [Candidatus Acidoferrum sp.]|nr:HAD family phosphatase [Candidatus Acidoferrum sp.]